MVWLKPDFSYMRTRMDQRLRTSLRVGLRIGRQRAAIERVISVFSVRWLKLQSPRLFSPCTLTVHRRSMWYFCQGAPGTMDGRRSQKEMWVERTREESWNEDQEELHTYKTGGSHERTEFSSSLLLPSKRPHVCFRKVFLPPMQQSGKEKKTKHTAHCLQKLRCFPIKGLLLTQNWESNSHCE